jgi:hypothetical protein
MRNDSALGTANSSYKTRCLRQVIICSDMNRVTTVAAARLSLARNTACALAHLCHVRPNDAG